MYEPVRVERTVSVEIPARPSRAAAPRTAPVYAGRHALAEIDLVSRDENARSAARAGETIQRAMGMEVETALPIFQTGGVPFAGDTTLIDHKYYTLVTDYRKGGPDGKQLYSNLEFVMKHFNQMTGTLDDAEKELLRRFGAMQEYWVRLHSTMDARRTLAEVHPYMADEGLVSSAPSGTYVDPTYAHDVGEKLYVHYTVGYAPEDVIGLVTSTLASAKSRPTEGKLRAAESPTVATNVAKFLVDIKGVRFSAAERARLEGYVALVFMNVAAFHDDVAKDPAERGQVKNLTSALSRVPLKTAFETTLDDAIKDAIEDNFDDVEQLIADPLGAWNDDHTRQVVTAADVLKDPRKTETPVVKLGDYLKSALGRGAVIPQMHVFGGMRETDVDATVKGRGIPMELRNVGKQFVTWKELWEDAKALLKQSRGK